MIARGAKGGRKSAKDTRSIVVNFRHLAVQQAAANNMRAEMLTNGLVTKTYAQQRNAGIGAATYQLKSDTRIVGSARARGKNNSVRGKRHECVGRHGIIAFHPDFSLQFLKIMHDVEDEAVIIVDEQDHGRLTVFSVKSGLASDCQCEWRQSRRKTLILACELALNRGDGVGVPLDRNFGPERARELCLQFLRHHFAHL